MYSAGSGSGMPYPHEVLAASMGKERNCAMNVIADDTKVVPILIHRPRRDFGETVTGGEPHGIDDLRIVRNRGGCIVPPVEAMPDITAVAERDSLLQKRGLWPQQ